MFFSTKKKKIQRKFNYWHKEKDFFYDAVFWIYIFYAKSTIIFSVSDARIKNNFSKQFTFQNVCDDTRQLLNFSWFSKIHWRKLVEKWNALFVKIEQLSCISLPKFHYSIKEALGIVPVINVQQLVISLHIFQTTRIPKVQAKKDFNIPKTNNVVAMFGKRNAYSKCRSFFPPKNIHIQNNLDSVTRALKNK